MQEFSDDDIFLSAIEEVMLDALACIGQDRDARTRLFREVVIVARNEATAVAREAESGSAAGPR